MASWLRGRRESPCGCRLRSPRGRHAEGANLSKERHVKGGEGDVTQSKTQNTGLRTRLEGAKRENQKKKTSKKQKIKEKRAKKHRLNGGTTSWEDRGSKKVKRKAKRKAKKKERESTLCTGEKKKSLVRSDCESVGAKNHWLSGERGVGKRGEGMGRWVETTGTHQTAMGRQVPLLFDAGDVMGRVVGWMWGGAGGGGSMDGRGTGG